MELWKAGVTSATILKQLKISKCSLWRILRKVKENPLNPDLDRKKGTGPKKLIKPETLATMKKLLNETPTLTAKSLKNKVPALHSVSIRRIKRPVKKIWVCPRERWLKNHSSMKG